MFLDQAYALELIDLAAIRRPYVSLQMNPGRWRIHKLV